MKKQLVRWMGVALAGLMVTACASRKDVEELKKNQEKILAKLDKVGRAPAAPQRGPQPGRPDPSAVYAWEIGESAIKGPKEAWVTVIESSDFQCPFCSRVTGTMKQIEEKYGDDVRIVFKHNPLGFHQRAMPAAQASECAGDQGKFWEYHDQLFANQRSLDDPDLEKYAKAVGVKLGDWKKCYTSGKHKDRIQGDQRTGTTLGARGTPAFFINGRFLSGAQPFPAFEKIIDEELKKAKASGISKKDYYKKAVVAKGKKKV